MGHYASCGPEYAAPQDVLDAVDDLAQVRGSGTAPFGVGRQQGSQFLSLGIGQIAGIRLSTHTTSVVNAPS